MREPRPALPAVDAEPLEPLADGRCERRRGSRGVVVDGSSRRSSSRGSRRGRSSAGPPPGPPRRAHAAIAGTSSAGREPRKARVTCRFCGGTSLAVAFAELPAAGRRQLLALPSRRARRRSRAAAASAQKSLIRASPATLGRRLVPCPSRLRDNSAHEVQRSHRRAPANRLPVAREVEAAGSSPAGPAACRKTRPTGLASVPPPGPATPVTATADIRAELRTGPLGHRRGNLFGHGAVLGQHGLRARRAAPL